MKYEFIRNDKIVKINLTAEQQKTILAIHDDGLTVCKDPDKLQQLYAIIAQLKDGIHP